MERPGPFRLGNDLTPVNNEFEDSTKKGYANIQTGYASIRSSKSNIRIGGSTHAKSGTETRPINMKVLWIMKCWWCLLKKTWLTFEFDDNFYKTCLTFQWYFL